MEPNKINGCLNRYNQLLIASLQETSCLVEAQLRDSLFKSIEEYFGIKRNDFIEYESTSAKPVDAYTPNGPHHKLAFEFHIENSPKTQANQTQRAGVLFSHFHRLAAFQPKIAYKRYLVFNTDETMARYFSQERRSNDLTKVWYLSDGQSVIVDESYYLGRSQSFVEKAKAGKPLYPCKVTGVYRNDKFGHPWYWTRVYLVEPLP